MQTIDLLIPATPTLAMSRHEDRSITLHALGNDGMESVGTFASAKDAWAAVDALDLAGSIAA
jgi:hypothetical protein